MSAVEWTLAIVFNLNTNNISNLYLYKNVGRTDTTIKIKKSKLSGFNVV